MRHQLFSANNTSVFKNRLGRYWQHQDIIYDFRSQMHGTTSRSINQSIKTLIQVDKPQRDKVK